MAILSWFFNRQCTICRGSYPQDRGGGQMPTYTPPQTFDPANAVPVCVQQATAKRIAAHQKMGSVVDTTIFFFDDPGVNTKDTLVLDDGRIYTYMGPCSDASGRAAVFEADCEYRKA